MSTKVETMKSLYDEGKPFSDLLPYFTHEEGVFVLKDGSIGQIWEFTLIESDGRGEEYLTQMANNIEGLLTRLPEQIVSCQFILTSDDDFSDRLEAYVTKSEALSQNIVKVCSEAKLRHMLEGKKGFFDTHTGPFCAKRIRAFFTLRFFPVWIRLGWMDKMIQYFTGENLVRKKMDVDFKKNCEQFARYCDIVEGVFKGCEISFRRVKEKGLFRILYKLLNPKRSKNLPCPEFHEDEYLADQLLYNSPRVTDEGLILDDCATKVITLKELPIQTETGMFTAEIVRGVRFSMLDLIPNFTMVVNFYVPNQDEAMRSVKLQKTFAFAQRGTVLGDKSVEAIEQKEELDSVIKETYTAGHKVVYPRIHFLVQAEDNDKTERAVSNVLSALTRMGAEGLKEEIIGSALEVSCLPLCFDHYYERFIKRTKRMVTNNLADMLPMYGSIKGASVPAAMYLNRRGEPVFMDLFAGNNPHLALCGSSGSGKSFFINDFCLQGLRLKSHFFVLDKGDSYLKLCRILGGQYVRFELGKPVTINPFVYDLDPEHLAFLVTMLSEMCSGGDERDRLSREHEGVLQKAIQEAYKDKDPEKEVVLSDVAAKLNSKVCNADLGIGENIGSKLALKMSRFCKDGAYGKFFDGQNQFILNKEFTVFELGNLNSNPDLQLVVLLNIMNFVTNFVARAELKDKRKYLLIDEAWALLRLKNTAEFITNSFKTYRKYGCSAVAITQEITDLTGKECGSTILAVSANKIFLRQEPQAVEFLKPVASLSQPEVELLKSIETQKGKFSEALLLTDSSKGVIRLVPDPFLYWVATSDAKDNAFFNEKLEECSNDYVGAIEKCVKEYPYGIR